MRFKKKSVKRKERKEEKFLLFKKGSLFFLSFMIYSLGVREK